MAAAVFESARKRIVELRSQQVIDSFGGDFHQLWDGVVVCQGHHVLFLIRCIPKVEHFLVFEYATEHRGYELTPRICFFHC